MKRLIASFFAVVFMWCVPAFAGIFSITGGAPPINKTIIPVIPEFKKEAPDALVTIVKAGPKKGLEDLLAGRADVLVVIMGKEQLESFAHKEGIKMDSSDLVFAEIASDKIYLAVHPTNPVKLLTPEQINRIFSGSISNWKEVGGNDQEIIIAWSEFLKGVNDLVKAKYKIKKLTELMVMPTADGVAEAVSSNPEAIGIVGEASMKKVKVKGLEPPMEVKIYFITKGEPTKEAQSLIGLAKKNQQK